MQLFKAIVIKEKQFINRTEKWHIMKFILLCVAFPFISVFNFFNINTLFNGITIFVFCMIPTILLVIELITQSMITENEDQMMSLLLSQGLNKFWLIMGKCTMPLLFGCIALMFSLTVNIFLNIVSVKILLHFIFVSLFYMLLAIFISIFLSLFFERREYYQIVNTFIIFSIGFTLLYIFKSINNDIWIYLGIIVPLDIVFFSLCCLILNWREVKLTFSESIVDRKTRLSK